MQEVKPMQNRVRVRRDRPSALTWALALAVTMLAVYLITLSAPGIEKAEDAASDVRVTRELTFEGMTVYFADLGAYPDEWQARVAAAGYAGRGAAGVVYEGTDGFHVLGAGYALEADAKRIAERLGAQEGIETGVLTLTAPSISLRVTAPESDAEAIAEADRVLRQQLTQLNSLALQVDRGEVSFASARTLARVAASEARSARKALEAISGGADQPVCAALISQLTALEGNLSAVSKANGDGAELSGRLRCCHVDGALRLMDFLKDPGGQAQ